MSTFFEALPRGVLWRSETSAKGEQSRVPYSVRGYKASHSNPASWCLVREARRALAECNGNFDGVGVVLGDLGNGETLAGLDLDTCLIGGTLAPWAQAYLNVLPTYAEVSPSGTGLKLFFRFLSEELEHLQSAFGMTHNQYGCKKVYEGALGRHPPAAELYLTKRYFTLTGMEWHDSSVEVALLPLDTLQKLAVLMGRSPPLPSPVAALSPLPLIAPPTSVADLMVRLNAAMLKSSKLAERWNGSRANLVDTSNSGFDMSLVALLKQSGFTDYEDVRLLLRHCPHSKSAAKLDAGDERYVQRMWDRSGDNFVFPQLPVSDVGEPPASEAAIQPAIRASVLWCDDEDWDEAAIPVREWLAEGYLMRGTVSLIIGTGSAGKSMFFKSLAAALCLGMTFGRFAPKQICRVLSYSIEDDMNEERRRLSAVMRAFGRAPSDLQGRLRRCGPHEIGTLIERNRDGEIRLTEAVTDLLMLIEQHQPDVVILDPLIELHNSDENDNTALRAVLANLRGLIAVRYKCALLVAHHAPKGTITPGDPNASRGAGSIVAACRAAFTLCVMSEEESADMGVPFDRRRSYFRLDSAKMNYHQLDGPEWFERVPFTLLNGEVVVAAVPWAPPDDSIGETDVETIKRLVAEGFGNGEAYCLRGGVARSLAHLCGGLGLKSKRSVQTVATALRQAGFMEAQYYSRARNAVLGLRAPDGRPFSVKWADDQLPVKAAGSGAT